jgi:rubrerythrin
MEEETIKAFEELRRAVAAQFGVNADELVMSISTLRDYDKLANNGSCARCGESYYDESGCDPCPHCGASYFDQIFPGWYRIPRLPRLKKRRRAARRALSGRRSRA